jgi:hypothetical protein
MLRVTYCLVRLGFLESVFCEQSTGLGLRVLVPHISLRLQAAWYLFYSPSLRGAALSYGANVSE